jgi:protoporphyrinogen oxidase
LYLTFFKSYTEKVWGVPCDQISAEWGAQRIKGLSLKRRGCAFHLKKTFGQQAARRHRAEKDRNLADRKISLPQVRSRAALGACRGVGAGSKGGEMHHGIQIDRIHVEGKQDRIALRE